VASSFGRNVTPSGVVMDSGTETSTQAIAPSRRRSPADLIVRSSSRIFATVVSSQPLAVLVHGVAESEDAHHLAVGVGALAATSTWRSSSSKARS
jgi:hypothetical protein